VRALTRGTVVIDVDRCKGCELCIPACRPGVLEMSEEINAQGVHFPVLFAGCTACQACRQVCPDYVFEVYRFAEPAWMEDGREQPAGAARREGAA
jgi:2-oxoglutarate ferredoxin oxidoreductase subunit delta